ncbi:MAG: hypothetical protein ABIC68_06535 [Candidatus Omnitrophota bacterium]
MPKDVEISPLMITKISTLGDLVEVCVTRLEAIAPKVMTPMAISVKPKKMIYFLGLMVYKVHCIDFVQNNQENSG